MRGKLDFRFGDWDVIALRLILVLVMIFMPKGLFVRLRDASSGRGAGQPQRGAAYLSGSLLETKASPRPSAAWSLWIRLTYL